MDGTLFNIGPLEFILILVIMFIFLGPEGMVRMARQIGTWIRQAVRSPMWTEIMGYSREIRELPTKIVKESGLDEDLKEIQAAAKEATQETQASLNDARREIDQSLKETGSVQVQIGTNGALSTNLPIPVEGSSNTIAPPEPPKPTPIID